MATPPFLRKKSFIKSGEGTIATYDWTDIADGTGFGTFYLTQEWDGSATTYGLVADTNGTENGVNTFAGAQTYSYDTKPFNTPRVVKGVAIASFWCKRNTGTSRFSLRLYKVTAGGSESAISASTYTATKITTSAARRRTKITLTQTKFKIGEYIRLKVTDATGSGNQYLGTDPANQADGAGIFTAGQTQSILLIPFRIDL